MVENGKWNGTKYAKEKKKNKRTTPRTEYDNMEDLELQDSNDTNTVSTQVFTARLIMVIIIMTGIKYKGRETDEKKIQHNLLAFLDWYFLCTVPWDDVIKTQIPCSNPKAFSPLTPSEQSQLYQSLPQCWKKDKL